MALDLVYPARCLACGAVVSEAGLCGPCWRETAFLGGTLCDHCGAPLPGKETSEGQLCDQCLASPRPWARGRAALLYKDTGRRLVLALKHGDRQEVARPAAAWMAQVARTLAPEGALVVPVPLHWSRLLRRRFNQSALLARHLAVHLQRNCCPDLLLRVRRTRKLDGLNRVERAEVLAGAIEAHPKRAPLARDRPILLVDDVMTSGATLAAATRACHGAGSGPVCVVTLARVAKDP